MNASVSNEYLAAHAAGSLHLRGYCVLDTCELHEIFNGAKTVRARSERLTAFAEGIGARVVDWHSKSATIAASPPATHSLSHDGLSDAA